MSDFAENATGSKPSRAYRAYSESEVPFMSL